MFLKPEKLQNHGNKGKGKEKKKSEEKERRKRKKSNGRTLRFYNGYLLWRSLLIEKKKLLDAKGPFGDNVFKNPG